MAGAGFEDLEGWVVGVAGGCVNVDIEEGDDEVCVCRIELGVVRL